MNRERPCVDVVYQKLIHSLAQAFYYDWSLMFPEEIPPEATPSTSKKKPPADFTGLGAVVLTALLCRPWWKEDELADVLRLPLKPVRRILRLLETHGILAREHRKQKKRKRERAGHEQEEDEDEENDGVQENDQGQQISYSSIDYQHTYDVAMLRVYKLRQALKAELEDRRAVQEYQCQHCDPAPIYTTLNINEILRPDGSLMCPECDSILRPKNEDDENMGLSRKERRKRVEQKQATLEDALRPLVSVLAQIESLAQRGEQIPDFGTLNQWSAREAMRLQEAQNISRGPGEDHDTRLDITIGGAEETSEEIGQEAAPRELPPWLRAQQSNGTPAAPANADSHLATLNKHEAKEEEEKYMKLYKEERMELKVDKMETKSDLAANSGWQEVGLAKSEDEPKVKQEQNGVPTTGKGNGFHENSAVVDDEEEDWEDA